jgi:hypothetical protein
VTVAPTVSFSASTPVVGALLAAKSTFPLNLAPMMCAPALEYVVEHVAVSVAGLTATAVHPAIGSPFAVNEMVPLPGWAATLAV